MRQFWQASRPVLVVQKLWSITVIKRIWSRHGQALVHSAVILVVLMLLLGLAIDAGLAYAVRRQMQNAADAGALAGASMVDYTTGLIVPGQAVPAAQQQQQQQQQIQKSLGEQTP